MSPARKKTVSRKKKVTKKVTAKKTASKKKVTAGKKKTTAKKKTAKKAAARKKTPTKKKVARKTKPEPRPKEPVVDVSPAPEPVAEASPSLEPLVVPPAPEDAPQMAIDEVAGLFVQAYPDFPEDLESLRDGLLALAANAMEASATENASRLGRAAEIINDKIHDRVEDAEQSLIEVGSLIEEVAESEEGVATPAPAAGPEPVVDPEPVEGSEEPGPSAEPVEVFKLEEGAFSLPDDADAELLPDFINESRELLEGAEEGLLTLEADPEDMEAIGVVFRGFHTIKGTSAFLGLQIVSELAHKAENLFSRMRDQEIRCTGGYADLALRSVDALKELIEAANDALSGQDVPWPAELEELMNILLDPEAAGYGEAEQGPEEVPRLGNLLVAEGKVDRETVEEVASAQGEQPLGVALVRSEKVKAKDVAQALRTQRKIKGDGGAESTIRVRTGRLDQLIDMVGELVIAQSMVAQDSTLVAGEHLDLVKKVGHTGKIVRELQDMSMSLRMVPLKGMFKKMVRVVRDVAQKNGKQVDFVTDGEDTEIDRNMVDLVTDPLVHMVRNAADHGIEPPEEREIVGKPPAGKVRLSAYHASGNVVVELRDDGRGLDREKIAKKAIANGLIETDKGMSDSEVFNLIFEAGFSTAEKITDVSGRGVGLDVVKRNVEKLQGRVEISSEIGKGTVFSVKLPLTLAITDSMLVRVGSQRYIIPTHSIYMSFRPSSDALPTVTERGELVRLRDTHLPMFRLGRLFDVPDAVEDPTQGLVVIVNDGEHRFALLVDELLGQQQVVVKSLSDGIGKVPGVSGGAILGDGQVGLILEPPELAALGRQTTAGEPVRSTGASSAA